MGMLYDTDIIAWSLQQAALLRERRWQELDLDNIVEEIEEVGRSYHRELAHRFSVLITHLLKWRYQQQFRGKSWQTTIEARRSKLARRLKKTPSLRHEMANDGWLRDVWGDAVDDARSETGLSDTFPDEPLWSIEEILDPQFYPDADL